MKQNIIMIIILVMLFFFGLLIYDFSDELDVVLSDNNWYKLEEKELTVLSFKDREFSYYYKSTEKPFGAFEPCTTFRYNRSINIIKLNCNIKENKLFIASVDDSKLTITINGIEKTFYVSEEEALKADFIETNNLNEDEFVDLMDTSLSNFKKISVEELIELRNGKDKKLIAFVTKVKTIQNALNLKALNNLNVNTNIDIHVVDIDLFTEDDTKDLEKINLDIAKLDEATISIFNIGNKKTETFTNIVINTYNEKETLKQKE